MLEDSLFESRGRGKTRKPFTVAIAVVAHLVAIAVLVLIPLLETHALALPPIDRPPFPPAPRIPDNIPVTVVHAPSRTNAAPITNALAEPTAIPAEVVITDDSGPAAISLLPSGTGAAGSFLPNLFTTSDAGLAPGLPPAGPPPPPPLPPPPVIRAERPIPIGGKVQAANIIQQVKPAYPDLARQARVQGTVVMEAVIRKDGSVGSLRILSGHPLLSQAAIDAVRQWKYRPTLLNGDPVEVLTTITVTFTLQ